MDYIIICATALFASALTLFSGFGLGSLLLPAFAIFFPAEMAVALTAVVHFLNNIFKFTLLGKYADKSVVLRFGIPAILSAYVGARALLWLAGMQPLVEYELFSTPLKIMPVNLTIGILIIIFSLVEIHPRIKNVTLDKRYLPAGGLLSGFFGGISGHQGALRTMFLIRSGLTKEAFIATGIIISLMVDVSRLFVYSERFTPAVLQQNMGLLIAAVLSAFIGAFVGSRLMKKITMRGVQVLVSIMLFVLAVGLIMGLI